MSPPVSLGHHHYFLSHDCSSFTHRIARQPTHCFKPLPSSRPSLSAPLTFIFHRVLCSSSFCAKLSRQVTIMSYAQAATSGPKQSPEDVSLTTPSNKAILTVTGVSIVLFEYMTSHWHRRSRRLEAPILLGGVPAASFDKPQHSMLST